MKRKRNEEDITDGPTAPHLNPFQQDLTTIPVMNPLLPPNNMTILSNAVQSVETTHNNAVGISMLIAALMKDAQSFDGPNTLHPIAYADVSPGDAVFDAWKVNMRIACFWDGKWCPGIIRKIVPVRKTQKMNVWLTIKFDDELYRRSVRPDMMPTIPLTD